MSGVEIKGVHHIAVIYTKDQLLDIFGLDTTMKEFCKRFGVNLQINKTEFNYLNTEGRKIKNITYDLTDGVNKLATYSYDHWNDYL